MNYEKLAQRAIQISLVLSVITLIMYAIIGTQARMIADDYCTASGGLQHGPFVGTFLQYNSWAGQYVNVFIKYSLAPFQPTIHSWLPALTLIFWLLSLAYCIYHVFDHFQLPKTPGLLASATIFITYSLYRIMPAYQHAFWFAAIIPYTWSLIIGTVWFGSVLHFFAKKRTIRVLIGFLFWSSLAIFLMGGLIETTVTCLALAFLLLFIAIPFISKERRISYASFVITGGLSSGCALLIGLLSPGSLARRQGDIIREGFDITPLEALPGGTLFTLAYTFGEPVGITFGQTFAIAFLAGLFLLGFVWGMFYLDQYPELIPPTPKNVGRMFWLSLIAGLLLIFAVIYPAYYAGHGDLPMRPLILARLIQLFITIFWTYLVLMVAQKHNLLKKLRQAKTWSTVLLFVSFLFLWMPAVSIYKLVNLFPNYQAYAQSWDERHEVLLNAEPGSTVIVPPLAYDIEDSFVLEKLDEDPTFWINGCVAGYYNLESVALESVDDE